ncbi:MAG TPA: SPFH domain-containing protein [Planktothrix sp.]|jgi:regulator of protease activity HflC (stomatin/prohibitin superfamily)
MEGLLSFIVPGIIVIAVIITLKLGLFSVRNQSAKIIERFGKYNKTAHAGLNFKIPYVDSVRDTINLQVQQHPVAVDTITKDKVSVRISVAVNYQVKGGKEADAYYKLGKPETQIETFVFDVVRSQVPKQTLDEVFDSKDAVALAVTKELEADMSEFGYQIVKVSVTEVEPDAKVKAAMNDINAAQREQEAANSRGEAAKTLQVKAAEAKRDSDKLYGEGIAQQRLAIIDGMKKSVEDLKSAYPTVDEATIINMLMMTQYFETLQVLSKSGGTNTIFVPGTPAGIGSFRQEIMEGLAVRTVGARATASEPAALPAAALTAAPAAAAAPQGSLTDLITRK